MGGWRGVELEGLTLAEPGPAGLRLRPYRPDDVAGVLAAMQDPRMARYLPLPQPYTPADAREFCTGSAPAKAAEGRGVELAMTLGADDAYVGGAGLTLPGPRDTSAEIGYSVAPSARGAGLAARATRLLAAWGLGHGVERLEVRVAVTNLASARAALRAGFRFESERPADHVTAAGTVDGAVFVRFPDDTGEPVPPWLPPLDGVEDDVVTLRVVGPGDGAVVAEDVTDEESRRWAVGDPCADPDAFGRNRATAAGLRWLVGPGSRAAVVDRASGEVAGVLELRRGGPPDVVELGYFVRAAFRGHGTTVRALGLLRDWAFGPARIARLELGADVANTASHVVATRAGFVREGVCAGRLRHPDGGFRDEVRFGLTR